MQPILDVVIIFIEPAPGTDHPVHDLMTGSPINTP